MASKSHVENYVKTVLKKKKQAKNTLLNIIGYFLRITSSEQPLGN